MVVKNCTPAAKKQATGTAAKVITPAKKGKYVSFSRGGGKMNKTFFSKEIVRLEQVADTNLILVTVTVQASNNNPFLNVWVTTFIFYL